MAETSYTRSNIAGLGDVTLSHFNISATLLTATTLDTKVGDVQQLHTATTNANYAAATRLVVKGDTSATSYSYVKLGSHKYMFWANKSYAASVVALATHVDASLKGSMFLAKGKVYFFTADATATTLAVA